jgi:hypothetical protein
MAKAAVEREEATVVLTKDLDDEHFGGIHTRKKDEYEFTRALRNVEETKRGKNVVRTATTSFGCVVFHIKQQKGGTWAITETADEQPRTTKAKALGGPGRGTPSKTAVKPASKAKGKPKKPAGKKAPARGKPAKAAAKSLLD